MNSTPLFDSIARRSDHSLVPPIVPSGYAGTTSMAGRQLVAEPVSAPVHVPAVPRAVTRPVSIVAAAEQPAVTRPITIATVPPVPARVVPDTTPRTASRATPESSPRQVVSAHDVIDHLRVAAGDRAVVATVGDIIIRRIVASIDEEVTTIDRRRAVVDALGDRITQLVVDAIADELDRIDRDLAIPGV